MTNFKIALTALTLGSKEALLATIPQNTFPENMTPDTKLMFHYGSMGICWLEFLHATYNIPYNIKTPQGETLADILYKKHDSQDLDPKETFATIHFLASQGVLAVNSRKENDIFRRAYEGGLKESDVDGKTKLEDEFGIPLELYVTVDFGVKEKGYSNGLPIGLEKSTKVLATIQFQRNKRYFGVDAANIMHNIQTAATQIGKEDNYAKRTKKGENRRSPVVLNPFRQDSDAHEIRFADDFYKNSLMQARNKVEGKENGPPRLETRIKVTDAMTEISTTMYNAERQIRELEGELALAKAKGDDGKEKVEKIEKEIRNIQAHARLQIEEVVAVEKLNVVTRSLRNKKASTTYSFSSSSSSQASLSSLWASTKAFFSPGASESENKEKQVFQGTTPLKVKDCSTIFQVLANNFSKTIPSYITDVINTGWKKYNSQTKSEECDPKAIQLLLEVVELLRQEKANLDKKLGSRTNLKNEMTKTKSGLDGRTDLKNHSTFFFKGKKEIGDELDNSITNVNQEINVLQKGIRIYQKHLDIINKGITGELTVEAERKFQTNSSMC